MDCLKYTGIKEISAKLETTLLPSNECLKEMGVGSSEERNSASCTMSFAAASKSVSNSTDEICDEATSNLDVPKFNNPQCLPTQINMFQRNKSLSDLGNNSAKQNETVLANTPMELSLLDAPNSTQQANLRLDTSILPLEQPSTSQKAALIEHQMLQEKEIKQPQQQIESDNGSMTKIDNFVIFRNEQLRDCACNTSKAIDHFSMLSDEIILQIMKWLPKKALLCCGLVCRRFYQCSADDSLWTRLDLGGRSIPSEGMPTVLTRGVVVLRLAQTNFIEPVFSAPSPHLTQSFQSKLQFLDLSLGQIDKCSLRALLSYCRQLKKLSLEQVPLNNDICDEIAENTNLEALNLAMCTGLEAWSIRKMFFPLKNLTSLNISWTNLSVDAVTSLVTHLSPNLLRLNVAGCRKKMFNTHVASLSKRCPHLIELDLSDCTGLTGSVITVFSNFNKLEHLSLSRCYLIPAIAYLNLKYLHTLAFLDVFGTLNDDAINLLECSLVGVGINEFLYSSVARPTIGTSRTSIWGLPTRDHNL